MPNLADFSQARSKRDTNLYRLHQAQILIDLFKEARGREPASVDEIAEFIKARKKDKDKPLTP